MGTGTDSIPRNEAWLIKKDNYFYRPDCSGYTRYVFAAGRYTEQFAKSLETRSDASHSIRAIRLTDIKLSEMDEADRYVHKLTSELEVALNTIAMQERNIQSLRLLFAGNGARK